MKDFSYLKKSIYSGVTFFMTVLILSIGYAAYTTMSPVVSGQALTKDLWNTMVTNLADHESRISSLTTGVVPTGAVFHFAMNTCPTGYIKANGSLVNCTTYATLFSAIGTTFGVGDGSTTFTLPDLRGEFIRGWDDARGVDSGRGFGSWQVDMFKSHTHHASFSSYPLGNANSVTGYGYDEVALNRSNYGATTDATGGGETRPRNVALLACIKF